MLEAVDATRTLMLITAGARSVRSVMVTSAVSGEGKTSLAVQLAASLARVGYRTLLVDGDLRRPGVHEQMNLPLGVGLGELLRNETTPDQAIQPTAMENLWVVTAGSCNPQTFQALARDKGREVFKALGEGYDFLVVDSAPLLPVIDSQQIGRHMDGVILALRRDVSRMPSAAAACERLATLGIRILGAVVNGMTSEHQETRYQYSSPASPAAAESEEAIIN